EIIAAIAVLPYASPTCPPSNRSPWPRPVPTGAHHAPPTTHRRNRMADGLTRTEALDGMANARAWVPECKGNGHVVAGWTGVVWGGACGRVKEGVVHGRAAGSPAGSAAGRAPRSARPAAPAKQPGSRGRPPPTSRLRRYDRPQPQPV